MSYNLSTAYLSNLIYDSDHVNQNTNGATFIDPQGYTWSQQAYRSDDNGYQGAVFVNQETHQVVLVNRGTEPSSGSDVYSDLQMGIGHLPDQFASADELFKQAGDIAASFGQSSGNVFITGHSLGGSLSELLAAKYADIGVQAETYNPYGVGNLLPQLGITGGTFNNIVNQVTEGDPVSVLPGSKMLGTTYAYSTSADRFWNSPVGDVLAELPLNTAYYKYVLDAHSASNFLLQPELADESGRKVNIDVPGAVTVEDAVNEWYTATANSFVLSSLAVSGSVFDGAAGSAAFNVMLNDVRQSLGLSTSGVGATTPGDVWNTTEYPSRVTCRWRDPPLNRPEAALVGVMFPDGAYGMDTDMVLSDCPPWICGNAGVSAGSVLKGLLGDEVDALAPSSPANVTVVATSPYTTPGGLSGVSNATVYMAPSGAVVFAAGSMDWNWGLEDGGWHVSRVNPAVQVMTRNILNRFVQ